MKTFGNYWCNVMINSALCLSRSNILTKTRIGRRVYKSKMTTNLTEDTVTIIYIYEPLH